MSLDDAVSLLDEARTELRAAVAQVPDALRAVRPAPDRWSVADVLEHLAMVEVGVGRLLRKLAAEAEMASPDPARKGNAELDLRGLLDRSLRVESSAQVLPSRALTWSAALDELEQARGDLLAVIATVRHVPIDRACASHYLLGDLDGHQWIEFVARHEQRHAAQIREIGAELA